MRALLRRLVQALLAISIRHPRLGALLAFLGEWLVQALIALDQLINAAFMPLLTGSVGWADETLSARAWRERNARPGRVMRAMIDWMFSWQKPDPEIVDEDGAPITGHCERAYQKERMRRNLHPEYR